MDGSPESIAAYDAEIAGTKEFFRNVDVHDLPAIFAYWATKYIAPMWQELGVSDTRELFAKHLFESANRCGAREPVFASVGAGVCVVEVHVAQLLLEYGLKDFVIDCLELNPDLLALGRASADEAGVSKHLNFVETDLNSWTGTRRYDGFMVNHSLHHVVNLEHLFASVKAAMAPDAYFVVADMIGRNGHMRWPEALVHLHRFWNELPHSYRYNRLLKRHEELYENWDCSPVAFEGIRAQDILPLLLERFNFYKFCAFGNVIDVFVDRCFGHNFDPDGAWDRSFIDRVHAFDEAAIVRGELTPTQMLAVLTIGPVAGQHFARGLAPQQCVRVPNKMRTIAITGATGFIGRHIVDEFINAGWKVIALCRNPGAQAASDELEFRTFDLHRGEGVVLEDVEVLVHCALEPYLDKNDTTEPVNVHGSQQLFATARAQGVSKIVFVSSTTARESTPSRYGREKYQVEQFLDPDRDLIVRPGLVIGNGGLFRSMYRTLSKRGVAPLFFGGEKPVYSIFVQDLTSAMRRLIDADANGMYVLAAADAVSLKTLYRLIGRKAGKHIRLVPLPYAPTLFAVSLLERLGVTLPVSSGSIRGIANMQAIDIPQYELLGMKIRSCDAALESTNMAELMGR